jgi:hypothetical protein
MGASFLDDLAAAAVKREMPKASRKAAKKVAKLGGRGPLRVGKARSFAGGIAAPHIGPRLPRSAPTHPMTGAPRMRRGAPRMHGPMVGPMVAPATALPPLPAPRTGFNKYAHDASKWAKGHKKIVAGAGAVALWGTAMSNSSGSGSPSGTQNQARGVYGF